ncbi:hypothetical protein [Acidithiobacillus ferriphilus]|jgi:hypothetical protein|uniref:hypothetical protein n=1 Tax=Acidithiobacillus ferriphilus TaxID=1689834 RepID=UPI00242D79A9|nr:hypothetical protein [Acidithiobacillus ferriphilus]
MNRTYIAKLYRLRVLNSILSTFALLLWSAVVWAAAPDTPTTIVQGITQEVIHVLQGHEGQSFTPAVQNHIADIVLPHLDLMTIWSTRT